MAKEISLAKRTTTGEFRFVLSTHVFTSGVCVSLVAAALYGVLAYTSASTRFGAIALGLVLLAGIFVLAGALCTARNVRRCIGLVLWASAIAVVGIPVSSGQGVQALSLAWLPLLACLAWVLVGGASAIGLTLASIAAIAGIASIEQLGLLGATGISGVFFITRTIGSMLLVAAGAAAGGVLSRLIVRSLQSTVERENRFRSLLGVSADLYWEQDSQFRFTHMSRADEASDDDDSPASAALDEYLGVAIWDRHEDALSPAEWDAYRADLELRLPFRNIVMQVKDRHGQVRYISVSGQPLFDEKGRFRGYGGVTQFVTAEVAAESAMQASEMRYRQLFSLSPSPLLLQRNGVVLDANQAAQTMFDRLNRDPLVGTLLSELYEPGESRERLLHELARLETLPVGEGLAVSDYEMRARDGRLLDVQACAVQVEASGGPATLLIYFDITARKAAELAVRRSETMLSHLIATSPDLISLSEIESGRYALVNEGFCRATGYDSAEVVGKAAHEVRIFQREADRLRLTQEVLRQGTVRDLPIALMNKQAQPVSMLVSAASFEMDGRLYLVMNGRDVTTTERSRLEYEAILQNASIGIAFTRDGMFQHANPRFDEIVGWPQGSLTGQAVSEVWPDDGRHRQIDRQAGPFIADGKPFEVEQSLRRRDGSTVLCRILAQPIDPTHPSRGGTIWIAEDITERRHVEQALAHALDEAESANRAKSAFLANTSHEIRTPLNGLLGLARMALEPSIDEGRRNDYLNQLLDSAQNLSVIISDILDLSKIEAHKLSVESVPFDLAELLAAVHRAYQPLADARSIPLSLDIDQRLPSFVCGDAVRTRQILGNYIANALKFTETGTVRITAMPSELGGDFLRFEVIDSGPGIDPAVLPRLFKPFTQADESTTRRYGGTGLGLSICRELATLMGGDVGASSVPGRGSVFWVELPLPKAAGPAAVHAWEPVDPMVLSGARVLLVEDNPVNMLIADAMLQQWDVNVSQANDGQQAVEAVHRAVVEGNPFDAVLMDLQMPVMGGHEAARQLRRDYDADELPIIALTAAALVSEREEALAAGMNDFLSKPIDGGQLQRSLGKVIRRMRA